MYWLFNALQFGASVVIGTGWTNSLGFQVRVSRVQVRMGICVLLLNPYPQSGLPGYLHVISHSM